MKPRVFIGSSSEDLDIAKAVRTGLQEDCYPEVWSESLTALSSFTLENLINVLSTFDLAIFILSPNDMVKIRNEDKPSVRDNVIFEIGLFMGQLGREYVFLVKPKTEVKIHIPTDLLGLTYGEFDLTHPNKVAALSSFCDQVKRQINDLFKIEIPIENQYSDNILLNHITHLNSNDIRPIAVKSLKNKSIKIEIKHLTNVGTKENRWGYLVGSRKNFEVTQDMNRDVDTFYLEPNLKGIDFLHFLGKGEAEIKLYIENSCKPAIVKNITWG